MDDDAMRKLYYAYIGKEFREQGLHLILITLLVPTCFLIISFFADGLNATSPVFVEKVSFVCLTVALSAFGVDILGNETRKEKVHFLSRLPVGLKPSFATKTITYYASVLICFLAGTLIAYLIHLTLRQVVTFRPFTYRGNLIGRLIEEGTFWCTLSFFLTASLVLMAISCWVKKVGPSLALWMSYLLANKILSDWLFNQDFTATTSSMWGIAPGHLLWMNPLFALMIAYIAFVEGYRCSDMSMKDRGPGVLLTIIPLSFTLSQLLGHCGTNELFFYW